MPDAQQFQGLRDKLIAKIKSEGFSLFSDFAERHGSWEVTFSKSDNLHRYIIVDLTCLGLEQSRGQKYDVEVWIGAELQNDFVRRMVGQFTGWDDQLESQEFATTIQDMLERGISEVQLLTEDDLVAHYEKSILHTKAMNIHN